MRLERLLAVLVVGNLAGCGPSLSTQVRWATQAYDANEYRQEKDGVLVENREVKEMPASFYTDLQVCNTAGGIYQDENGQTKTVRVSFKSPHQMWYQVALTNKTSHVIRLNSTVIRLFDPAGNQNEPVQKDDLKATFLANYQKDYPCSAQGALNSFALIKMLDRNAEILPDTTITGWLAFAPPSDEQPGIWKLAVYEVPIATNEAGQVTKTTRFEVRSTMKKFVDTYKQDGMFSAKQLVESKEATD